MATAFILEALYLSGWIQSQTLLHTEVDRDKAIEMALSDPRVKAVRVRTVQIGDVQKTIEKQVSAA